MARLRVLLSSTCFDLGSARSKLATFIRQLGHEPILSEYSDVLFEPALHTQSSCIEEVASCDAVVLIIGGRFGGKAVPEALSRVDVERVASTSKTDISKSTISITQLEALHAIDSQIPIFPFVDSRVYHDHHVYEQNSKHDKELALQILYPSIERQDAAQYIFDFINFLRLRKRGNAIFTFSRIEDIEDQLRSQWSALFQRLIRRDRESSRREEANGEVIDQIRELRTAVISTISAPSARETARGVIRFRDVVETLHVLGEDAMAMSVDDRDADIPRSPPDVLREAGVTKLLVISSFPEATRKPAAAYLETMDGTGFIFRGGIHRFRRFSSELRIFLQLEVGVRREVATAWADNGIDERRLASVSRLHVPLEQHLLETAGRRGGSLQVESYSLEDLVHPEKLEHIDVKHGFGDFENPGDDPDEIPF